MHCSPIFSIRGHARSVASLPKDHDQASLGWPLLCFPWGFHLHTTSCSEFVSVFSTCPNHLPVSVVDIFPTGVTAIRWQQWFTETGQMSHSTWSDTQQSILLPELHAHSLKQIYTRKHTYTHVCACHMHSHYASCLFLETVKQNNSQYVWLIADIISGIYADLNWWK